METWLMKWLWHKLQSFYWKLILGIIVLGSVFVYFYRLLRPAVDKSLFLEALKTDAESALKENELRGRLEKDKIGAIKNVFEGRLRDTKKIDDRNERLKALIRLYEELDI
jgi:hypothetical protein